MTTSAQAESVTIDKDNVDKLDEIMRDQVRKLEEAPAPFDARLDGEAQALLASHSRSWSQEIAGFNRRHAICDAASAKAIVAYDTAHRAAFKRTLGWRYETARSEWRSVPAAQAEVTLTYSGPLRTGTTTVDGKDRGYCRAEAPDKLTATVHYAGGGATRTWNGPLPATLQGIGGELDAPAPEGTAEATPAAEIATRIAAAKSALERKLASIDADDAHEWADAACSQHEAEGLVASNGERSPLTEGRAKVQVTTSGPAYSGPIHDGDHVSWVCYATRMDTVTASALFDEEGEISLEFTTTVPAKPIP